MKLLSILKKHKAIVLPDKHPSHADKEIDCSTGTNSDPFAGQYSSLESILGGACGQPFGGGLAGLQQEQLRISELYMARQQQAIPSHLQFAMSAIPCGGVCQPDRCGRKHVDCRIVEPKGLPSGEEKT